MTGLYVDTPHHLRCFRSSDRELQIGIFLPVSEQEREFCEEAVIVVADGVDSLRVGVAIDTTLKHLGGTDKLLPSLKVVGVIDL